MSLCSRYKINLKNMKPLDLFGRFLFIKYTFRDAQQIKDIEKVTYHDCYKKHRCNLGAHTYRFYFHT